MSALYFSDFAAMLRTGDAAPMGAHLVNPSDLVRLRVYRNTALKAQIDALAAAYPAVAAAMGPERFEAMALAYAEATPLRARSLAEYGEGLDVFIAAHADDDALRAIAACATLDRAWLEAHSAADADSIDAAALQGADLEAAHVGLHPSLRIASMTFSVYAVWRRLRGEDAVAQPIERAATTILLWRPEFSVFHRALAPGDAAFIARIAAGAPLGAAARAAQETDPDFDVAGAFAGMLAGGVFTAPPQSQGA